MYYNRERCTKYVQTFSKKDVFIKKNLSKERLLGEGSVKDKETAGILAIFLGVYGAHWFYIGNKTRAIIYLLITLFVVGIGSLIIFILSIVDGIRFLCMTDEAFEREIAEPQEERANYETSKRVAKKDISKYDELKKAHVLRRDGILTEEEFFTLKEKILEE